MNKFAFISTNSIQQCCDFVLNKQRAHKYFMDVLKIGALLSWILLSGFFYLRFVSLASTEGYFLRQANNELSSTNFKYEIVKTELLDQTKENRTQMYGNNTNKKIINIHPEIVSIPNKTELTINK